MRKYRIFIDKFYSPLCQALDRNNLRDGIHLVHNLSDVGNQAIQEMLTISSITDVSFKEKINFLGVYYNLKLVQLNITSIDFLRAQVRTEERVKVYIKFMRDLGWKFRELTRSFLQTLFDINIAEYGYDYSDFLISSVGTRADQDDIDVAVITEKLNAKDLDKLLSQLNRVMIKFATPLHFHIAESFGFNRLYASIDEYKKFIMKNISNFVVITEILGSKKIIGSKRIETRFREEVLNLFYPQYSRDSRFHEAYLRIILGETEIYLSRKIKKTFIHPKNDALRMIKGLLTILKTRYSITKTNAWSILERLKQEDLKNWNVYSTLGESLAFFETIRFLYMNYSIQEERIMLDFEENRKTLEEIGYLMGIESIGAISPVDHLLAKYYEHLNRVKKVIRILLDDCKKYLGRISSVKNVLVDNDTNIAWNFAKHSAFFKGSRFWEDIIENFIRDDCLILKKFSKDFLLLSEKKRKLISDNLFSWLDTSFDGLLTFITYLDILKNDKELKEVRNIFLDVFFNKLNNLDLKKEYLLRFLKKNPKLINRFLRELNSKQILFLLDNVFITNIKQIHLEQKQADEYEINFKSILEIYGYGSWHFRKFFQRIIKLNPALIKMLGYSENIDEICAGIFAEVPRKNNRKDQKRLLGQFYDLEFIHTGLKAIRGEDYLITAENYISFTESYINSLLDICQLEVENINNTTIRSKDVFAVFTVGSTARGSSYNDDLDLLILLDSEDPDIFRSYNKIISKFNREIVKRGIIPQYRFADHFGNYVSKVSEVVDLLSTKYEGDYVERSQLLEAKPIESSKKMKKIFYDKLIKPFIFDDLDYYIEGMVFEIKSRYNEYKDNLFDIKEAPGGIKDIEMLLLIYKAFYELTDCSSLDLINSIIEIDKENIKIWMSLKRILLEFKKLRQFMRLTVAMDNQLDFDDLYKSARILGYSNIPNGADLMKNRYLSNLRMTKLNIDILLSKKF